MASKKDFMVGMVKKSRKIIFLPLMIFILMGGCGEVVKEEKKDAKKTFLQKRKEMVEKQIEKRGISDERVLDAMLRVERHRFVPEKLKEFAYIDRPLPIGEGQTVSQPYIVALMTQLLELEGDEKVLEIGTGSGYQAAILAELASQVYTIEILEPLASRAEKLLKDLGYNNITVKCGDGYAGWEEYAPFDAIIVTCAPPKIPQPLIDQLAEGGRMVIPVGEYVQELKLLRKKKSEIVIVDTIPVMFVPMTGEGVKEGEN
jgi:protein-L-isoaspartate(D-aspartate) O-methyltransferase